MIKKKTRFGDLNRQEKQNYVKKMNKMVSDTEFRQIVNNEATNI